MFLAANDRNYKLTLQREIEREKGRERKRSYMK
jgi:hypothetical protein